MAKITACTRDCPDACSLVLRKDAEGHPRISGNPDHPITAGFVCAKIKDHIARLGSSDRILYPQLKTNGRWETVTWKTALDLCAEKIQNLRHEPESILHIPGTGAKGVLKLATSLFFSALGASRVRGSLCDAAGIMAYVYDFGSRKNHDINDLANAESIVNWGKDLSRSSIHTAAAVKKARQNGTMVMTISPGGDGNESFSDSIVRIRPGTDRFLAAAVIKQMLVESRITKDVSAYTRRWDLFQSLIASLDTAELRSACDVSIDSVQRIASIYSNPQPTATLVGAGLQRYARGGETIRFINALALLSGNIGVQGGGSYYHLDTHRNFNLDWIKASRRKSRSLKLPLIGREILDATDPPIRMIWINGINIINQAADSNEIAKALEQVPFKVVVDAFMTDTADRADLILPAALMLEQEDIIGSFLHEYVQYACPVLEAPGEARDDYAILADLGKRLNPAIEIPDKETCFRQALDGPWLDTSLATLKAQHSIRANRETIPYERLRFDHPDGKYRFPTALHTDPVRLDDFPLRLLSLIRGDAIHSQISPDKQKGLPKVWVAPECEALNQIDREKDIYLVSEKSRLKVDLDTLSGLHPEAAVYRRGDWIKYGGGVNQLIDAILTDLGSGAAFYEQFVRLENG